MLIVVYIDLFSCMLLSITSFFFNYTATTEISTLSLHDALPISTLKEQFKGLYPEAARKAMEQVQEMADKKMMDAGRSEEHTSELQSPDHLVCRLLLEKKKKK